MAPHSTEATNGSQDQVEVPLHSEKKKEMVAEVGIKVADMQPKFKDKYEERDYLKGRLAAAFRIFGKYGFGKLEFLSKRSLPWSMSRLI
jgi:hypothetical protein